MRVTWNEDKCCHAGICVKSLPEVFRVEDRQFVIDSAKAREAEFIEVVSQCPSGGLTCED